MLTVVVEWFVVLMLTVLVVWCAMLMMTVVVVWFEITCREITAGARAEVLGPRRQACRRMEDCSMLGYWLASAIQPLC